MPNPRAPGKRPQVLAAVRKYMAVHKGYSPSVRDLMKIVGTNSSSLIDHHLKILEKEGRIKRRPGLARSIQIVEKRAAKK